ncbi:3'-5' exonuclease [Arenicella sp. 4NH20-0111]|uniref:exonuclease domain-containing protein n=1 Tax=Arenicella sp. 4NH20-0111 TaxID=3127648 RepID=UPI00310C7E86
MIITGAIKDKIQSAAQRRHAKLCKDGPLKELLSSDPPSRRLDLSAISYLVADLEMTGLNSSKDDIVSYGFTVIENLAINHSLSQHHTVSLSNANLAQSAPIHGLFHKDLAHGLSPKKALDVFLENLAGHVLVLHNAHLDRKFINAACQIHYGADLVWPTIDTMQIEAKRLNLKGNVAHKIDLANSRKRYGLPNYAQHNAAADALATAELFLAQLTRIDSDKQRKLHEVI